MYVSVGVPLSDYYDKSSASLGKFIILSSHAPDDPRTKQTDTITQIHLGINTWELSWHSPCACHNKYGHILLWKR